MAALVFQLSTPFAIAHWPGVRAWLGVGGSPSRAGDTTHRKSKEDRPLVLGGTFFERDPVRRGWAGVDGSIDTPFSENTAGRAAPEGKKSKHHHSEGISPFGGDTQRDHISCRGQSRCNPVTDNEPAVVEASGPRRDSRALGAVVLDTMGTVARQPPLVVRFENTPDTPGAGIRRRPRASAARSNTRRTRIGPRQWFDPEKWSSPQIPPPVDPQVPPPPYAATTCAGLGDRLPESEIV